MLEMEDELERLRREQRGRPGDKSPPLPYVDLAAELKPREWLVPERIPMRNVSMLGGEGSIGKSLLLMQLSGATVLAKECVTMRPASGPVLYMSCEEDDDEVRRRMEDVARHLGSSRKEMFERGLRFLSFAGRDAILAQPDRNAIMRPSPLFESLRRDALALRPKLIVLDTVADIFGGKEIDRAQTRQFITMLRGLAIDANAAVILAAHPSLTGIATDTGLSGSTGWHNSVRARMYFKAAPGDDNTLRVLEVKKNNYGPVNETIVLRWRDGVYVDEPGGGTFEQLAAEAEVQQLFLKLLRRFTEQRRNVSYKPSPTYAPNVFAEQPEAEQAKADRKALTKAMNRLFDAGKIEAVEEGRPSHRTYRIVEKTAPANPQPTPSQHPEKPSQHQPTGGGGAPPYNPPPVGRAKGGLAGGTPGPADRTPGEDTRDPPATGGDVGTLEQLAPVLAAWQDAIGIGETRTLDQVMELAAECATLKAALLAVAAMDDGLTISNVRLARWLRSLNEVPVDHLMLSGGGIDSTGSPLWTLTADA